MRCLRQQDQSGVCIPAWSVGWRTYPLTEPLLGSHVQFARKWLPAGDVEPVGQDEQLVLGTNEYVFAGHTAQGPPACPEKPLLHIQMLLPGSELESAGQSTQDVGDVASSALRYLEKTRWEGYT